MGKSGWRERQRDGAIPDPNVRKREREVLGRESK